VPPLAIRPVIELAFDPIAEVGDWHVRLQTIGIAVVILLALLLAARVARRTPVDWLHDPDAIDPASGEPNHLRRDDLLYIAVAALPGAVIGGRIGYVLDHLQYYGANPGAILDVSQGGYQLSLAVVGGTLTSAVVATLLDAPIRRWMHALILPLLFALAGGKLAMVLGGDGQGMPWDGPVATAYVGPGPWLSLAPEVPSHPSQAYEGFATIGVIAILAAALAGGAFPRRGAGAFLAGLAMWATARLLVAFTWRDRAVVGPLSADQVISIAIAVGAVILLATGVLRQRGPLTGTAGPGAPRFAAEGDPDWPDPGSRPPI
jgi:phosphatidylglycerol:prolipoprotein diacylglycerol transferase